MKKPRLQIVKAKNQEVIEPLIDMNHFHSIKIEFIEVQNSTTRTFVKEDLLPTLTVDEVQSDGLIISIPGNSCSKGHTLMLMLKIIKANRDQVETFHATARVLDIEDVGDTLIRATIKLVQFEEKAWQNFLEIFSKRQEEVNEFFKAAKGY